MDKQVEVIACALALFLLPAAARGQELTPGAYWPVPVGVNIVTAINNLNWGDVTFDPSLPVEDARATINVTAMVYTRALSIAGRSANIGILVPLTGGHLEGLYRGTPTALDRFGFADPRLRMGINLYGAPAMTPTEFGAYRLRTIVGASLTVIAPVGQYDHSKVVNLGSNRWAVNSELGISRGRGTWVFEGMAGVSVFADNTDFNVGHTRSQAPILSVQFHVTHRFSPRVWLAGDSNFYFGGRTSVDGHEGEDYQRNSRVGSTFSWALNRHHSLRASVSQGAYTTIGGDFTSIAIGYNYAWSR